MIASSQERSTPAVLTLRTDRLANARILRTGPFYVEGAEPGDVLVVRFEKIEPSRGTAWSSSVLAPYTADPAFLRHEAEREQTTETWEIDKQRGVAKVASGSIRPPGIEVPLRPMLGCVAVAPARKEAIATSTPGTFGGNMDYNGMVVGTTLMLPVSEPGALLFVGDGHARQGDGEVVGMRLRCQWKSSSPSSSSRVKRLAGRDWKVTNI